MINPFSISRVGIGHGAEPMSAIGLLPLRSNDGRSGYWRLFFMEMQEKALKESVKEAVSKVEKAPEVVAKVIKRKKPKLRVVPKETPVPSIPVVPLKMLPTTVEPSAYDYLEKLPPIALDSYLFSLHATRAIIKLSDHRKKTRNKKLAVFLLLAA